MDDIDVHPRIIAALKRGDIDLVLVCSRFRKFPLVVGVVVGWPLVICTDEKEDVKNEKKDLLPFNAVSCTRPEQV